MNSPSIYEITIPGMQRPKTAKKVHKLQTSKQNQKRKKANTRNMTEKKYTDIFSSYYRDSECQLIV